MTDRPVEPFVRTVTRVVGGPFGRHASRAYSHLNPVTVSIALGTVLWMLAVIRQNPCRQRNPDHLPDHFEKQCYSDIPVLFSSRGLIDGNTPFLDAGHYQVLEYPALTGWLMEFTRLVAVALGAPVGPGLSAVDAIAATNLFYSVNMVVLFLFWLVAIFAHLGGARGRGWDAVMLTAAPGVVLTGLINWDMMPVALTALGVFFWSRRRPGWAGLMLGLSMAAKLYAGFLLGPLLLLCWRAGKMREFGLTLGTFVVGWLIPNLPVMVLAPRAWAAFWTFNSDRGGDFGSLWYLFVLGGHPIPGLNLLSLGLFGLGCVGIWLLIRFAPVRPRIGQVFFLVLMAFMLTNKVYSPQYVLWVLPFLALARPPWRTWIIFTVGESLYVMAIWAHLGQYIVPGDGGPDVFFWAATLLRLGTQGWVTAQVALAVWHPERDIVRVTREGRGYVDDPSGGVLDGAPDVHGPARRTPRPATDERADPEPATPGTA